MMFGIRYGLLGGAIVLTGCPQTLPAASSTERGQTVRTTTTASLDDAIQRWHVLETTHPGPFEGSITIAGSKDKRSPHLVVGCMVHGDEIGCLPPVVDVLEKLQSREIAFSGMLTAFIGNPQAVKVGKRFVEQDLNRVFADHAAASLETERAKALMPTLLTADLFIDLHQTIEPTDRAFYTFGLDELSFYWARFLEGACVLATRPPGVAFAAGSLSATEYAANHHVPAITLESSQKGFSDEAFARGHRIILRAIEGLSVIERPKDVVAVRAASLASNELRVLKLAAKQTFSNGAMALKPGFQNFSKVQLGQVIGVSGNGGPLTAKATGYLLFPKYPVRDDDGTAKKPLPSDLFLIYEEAALSEFIPPYKTSWSSRH